ncbi:uncharacterized protein LOC142584940 isoform X2 [Dermacentor variabilis]
MVFLNGSDYEFTRYYSAGGKVYYNHLYSRLSMGSGDQQTPKIIVREKKEETNGTMDYVLLHYEEHSHCGIFYFVDTSEDRKMDQKCEAYIWNRTVKSGKETCLNTYETYCSSYKKAEQEVYHDECVEQPGC